jgi:hypothetical protein
VQRESHREERKHLRRPSHCEEKVPFLGVGTMVRRGDKVRRVGPGIKRGIL